MGYKLRTSCVVCTPEEGELHTDFVLTVWDTDAAVVTTLVVVFTGNGFFFVLVFPLDFSFFEENGLHQTGYYNEC